MKTITMVVTGSSFFPPYHQQNAQAVANVVLIEAIPPLPGWDSNIIIGALLLNGAWGLSVALLMRLLNRM